ncbi:hypothetical protein [Kocuria rosea]|uniref:hypothetical protein n=1 Tax=Kocuria rosea TaxID=1275 RepID=UPI000E04FF2C|nr:hypothetical protein [Kocuria rosea]STX06527.1 Uncharacterised protein [Kocuria rosea]
MTPSSTPGSPSPDDPTPWSDTGPHDSPDATRPLPPVSRFAAPAGGGSPHDAPEGGAGSGGTEDWSWYDDEDDQHTRPLPAVTAQRPVPEDPRPRTDPTPAVGAPGAAAGYGPAPGYGAGPAGPFSGDPSSGVPVDAATRLARQREEFGGLQLVPGFFGWLSAMALSWLLLALAGLTAAALGLRLVDGVGGVVDDLAAGSAAAWTGAAALGLVEFIAFLGGGYAAGRMARFSGARQGVSVWLWSLFGRSVATVAGLVWADTVGLAPVGVSAQALIGDLLVPGLLAVLAVLAVDLLAAVLGGLWGVRYHRRVDRWGDGPEDRAR